MNFKEIKELAINLYKQGKSEQEINKLCKVPITKEMIAGWIQETEEIEKSKKLAKLYKKMQKTKKIEMTTENKEMLVSQIQQIAFEILELEENNEMAMNELVRCFSIKREYDLGRNYGIKILEKNPKNIFALYNMSKLEMSAGNYEKSLEYNSQLLSIDPQNIQGAIQRTLINENKKKKEEREQEIKRQEEIEKQVEKIEIQEQQILKEIEEKNIDLEKEQSQFAKQKEDKRYTKENKQIYMENLQKMFYEGKLNSTNIEKTKEELYRYPDQVESAIFIAELYYLITEKEDKAIEELDTFIDSQYTLTPTTYHNLQEKISDFRNRLQVREMIEKNDIEKKKQNKEVKIEQRRYMMQIAQKLNLGTIKKEDVEEIVANLEKCYERDKAIYLIIKVYENIYGKEKALGAIEKYSRIHNISEEERKLIVKMKASTQSEENKVRTHDEKIKDRVKKKEKQKRFKKQISKQKIYELMNEGKSVKQIYEILEESDFVSLKSIAKMRAGFLKENEKASKEYEEDVKLAKEFLKDGYSINQVYNLFEYNIGKNVLLQLKEEIKEVIR